jgi:tetratricopeptide (TPR) repeat protein
LGKTALKHGDLYGGDAHLAEAYGHFPDSLTMATLLAETALEMGEIERSLDFYEKALAMAPTHRGALLGKAKCLSFLGRNHDAIQLLHEMIALGKWYLGEAHYWLAWNEHELGHMEKAVSTIGKAKNYLPMDTEVFTLSGVMAFEQERLDHAVQELEKAKKFDTQNAYCEAPFHLGMIYSRREEWESSGSNFERAGQCHSNEVRGLETLIFGIRASSLADARKQHLLLMRRAQKDKAALNEGTAFYNAAAGYFNAGLGERAWNCAISASQHEYFKDKANDLITKIRDTLKN